MKMTEKDYQKFSELIDKGIEPIDKESWTIFKQDLPFRVPRIDNREMYFRWAIFHKANFRIGDGIGIDGDINLYQYLNDDHIDTALKRYVKERGL